MNTSSANLMTATAKTQSPSIVVISGGTGMTAKQLLLAALAQFSDCNPQIDYQSKIRSAHAAVDLVRDAASRHALVWLPVGSVQRQ